MQLFAGKGSQVLVLEQGCNLVRTLWPAPWDIDRVAVLAGASPNDHDSAIAFFVELSPPVPIGIRGRGHAAVLEVPVDAILALQPLYDLKSQPVPLDVFLGQRGQVAGKYLRRAHKPTGHLSILDLASQAALPVDRRGPVIFDALQRESAMRIEAIAGVKATLDQLASQRRGIVTVPVFSNADAFSPVPRPAVIVRWNVIQGRDLEHGQVAGSARCAPVNLVRHLVGDRRREAADDRLRFKQAAQAPQQRFLAGPTVVAGRQIAELDVGEVLLEVGRTVVIVQEQEIVGEILTPRPRETHSHPTEAADRRHAGCAGQGLEVVRVPLSKAGDPQPES